MLAPVSLSTSTAVTLKSAAQLGKRLPAALGRPRSRSEQGQPYESMTEPAFWRMLIRKCLENHSCSADATLATLAWHAPRNSEFGCLLTWSAPDHGRSRDNLMTRSATEPARLPTIPENCAKPAARITNLGCGHPLTSNARDHGPSRDSLMELDVAILHMRVCRCSSECPDGGIRTWDVIVCWLPTPEAMGRAGKPDETAHEPTLSSRASNAYQVAWPQPHVHLFQLQARIVGRARF